MADSNSPDLPQLSSRLEAGLDAAPMAPPASPPLPSSTQAAPAPSAATSTSSTPAPPPSLSYILDVIYKSGIKEQSRLRKYLHDVLRADAGEIIFASFLLNPETNNPDVDPLTLMDPAKSPVGFLFILHARVKQRGRSNNEGITLLRMLDSFVNRADFNVLSGDDSSKLNSIARHVLAIAKEIDQLPYVARILKSLSYVWSKEDWNNLTGIHSFFLEACVLAHEYQMGLELVNLPVDSLYRHYYDLHYLDILRFKYFSGLLFAAVFRWEEASGAFESVVSVPSTAASAFQIAAYKKLLLIQLIKDGRTSALPRYVSSCVTRALKAHCGPYRAFVERFEGLSNATAKVDKLALQAEKDAFAKDNNLSLVQRVLDTWPTRQILILTKTYSDLSLADVITLLDTSLSPAEVVALLLSMHQQTLINVSIACPPNSTFSTSPATTIVSFQPLAKLPLKQTIDKIESLNARAAKLQNQLWHEDRKLGLNVKYLQKVVKEENAWNSMIGPGGAASGAGGVGLDEDLMESTTGGDNGGPLRKTYDDDY